MRRGFTGNAPRVGEGKSGPRMYARGRASVKAGPHALPSKANETGQNKQQVYVAVKASCPYSSQRPPSWRRWERPDFPGRGFASGRKKSRTCLSCADSMAQGRCVCDELRTAAGAAIRAVVNRPEMMQIQTKSRQEKRGRADVAPPCGPTLSLFQRSL